MLPEGRALVPPQPEVGELMPQIVDTTMSAAPAPGGATTVQCVVDEQFTPVPALPPNPVLNVNVVPSVAPKPPPLGAFAPMMKLVPVIVMVLPPAWLPPLGLTDVIVGVAGALP